MFVIGGDSRKYNTNVLPIRIKKLGFVTVTWVGFWTSIQPLEQCEIG